MTIAQAGATLDQQGLGSLAPFFGTELRLDHAALGALFGSIYLGSTLFTAPSGILVDRYGERRIVVGSGVAMGGCVVVGALVPNAAWLVFWLLAFGALYAASSPAGGRAILRHFARRRGLAMGVRQAGAPLGGAIGAVILPVVALHFGGYRAALLCGGIICAACAIAAGVGYRSTEDDGARGGPGLRTLVGNMRRFVGERRALAVNVTAFLLASGQYCVVAFLVVTLLRSHFRPAVASLSLAVAMIAGTVARPLWGLLSDRIFSHERAQTLAVIGAFGAGGVLWLSTLTGPGHVFSVVAVSTLVGASTIGFTGLLNTVFAELGGEQAAGSAMGVGLTFNYAAGFVAPPLFGIVVDHFSFALAWRFLALALSAAALIVLVGAHNHANGESR